MGNESSTREVVAMTTDAERTRRLRTGSEPSGWAMLSASHSEGDHALSVIGETANSTRSVAVRATSPVAS